jgi:protein-S-isoprenylcysteine O-methyltransferase Ste14
MSSDTFVLLLVNFLLIGLLPRLTFRRDGHFHLTWWLTAAPLFVAALTVIALRAGMLTAASRGSLGTVADAIAVTTSAVSIALMAATVGTHRIPLALWHQDDDAPVEIVTWGPYGRVRHPFYVSFLLALTATVLAAPHPLSVAALVAGLVALTLTARREERRLLASDLGGDYARYLTGTGRFLPRLRRPA